MIALQERGARDGLGALEVSAGERSSYRGAVSGGTKDVLITAAAESTDGYTPVRGSIAGAADTPLTLKDETASVRLQHDFDGVKVAARFGATFEEKRGAGLLGALHRQGSFATLTLAQPATEGVGGWRVQAWARGSDLANSSVSVAANRATTTPANNEFSTPANGYGLNAAIQGKLGGASWELGADARWAEGTDHEQFRFVNGALTSWAATPAGTPLWVGSIWRAPTTRVPGSSPAGCVWTSGPRPTRSDMSSCWRPASRP